MGLKAAIQALKKAEKLKEKVQSTKDLLNDNEAWICQQQLQRIYQQVLILDLEYALDRKVEQELWNHGFKNYIGTLQNLAKDKKNPKRPESQAMLSWCLEAASGFYLTLLQEICTAFDLDLPFRRKGAALGSGRILYTLGHLSQPHKSSCYYICQHCLVHLGDIARYRSQNKQAEAFYRHAVQLAPHSGQPYNQLALLEASRADRLSTVFHYVRSVALRHPFPAAATNLARTLTKSAQEQLLVEGRNKLSTSEYISVFLKFHGLLHAGLDFPSAEKFVKILTTTLTAHVATESLTSWKFVQMLAINLFALHHAGGSLDPEAAILSLTDEQLTGEESHARHLILHLLAGSLSALLLPVYTLKGGDALLEYYALPAIKLTLDWIRVEPNVLLDAAFTSRLQIWPSLCKLLNGLQLTVTDYLPDKFKHAPLPEDRDLEGFLPLERAFSTLRFGTQDWNLDTASINKLRAIRLVDFGTWLASQEDYHFIASRQSLEGGAVCFEAVAGQQLPPSDLLRELEALGLGNQRPSPSPAHSEAGSSWGSTPTSTPDPCLPAELPLQDRRVGILKPQGSLEKSREKETVDVGVWNNVVGNNNAVPKRGRQNVALQAIMRKTVGGPVDSQEISRALESKQVTFKTPSPNNSPSSSQGTDEISVLKASPPKPLPKPPGWQQPPPNVPLKAFSPPPAPPGVFSAFGGTPLPLYGTWREETPPLPPPPAAWWAPEPLALFPKADAPGVGDAYAWGTRDVAALHSAMVAASAAPHRIFPQPPPTAASYLPSPLSVFPANGNVENEMNKRSIAEPVPPEAQTLFSSAFSHAGTGGGAAQVGAGGSTYSLFSSSSWAPGAALPHPPLTAISPLSSLSPLAHDARTGSGGNTAVGAPNAPLGTLGQQSLWSGPGPSPLERLLEQQKQLREGPAPKGGT